MFKNRFLLVIGMLSLLLAAMAVVLPPANVPTTSAIQRGREAYAARWTGLSENYQNRAIDEAERQRSRSADTARWTSIGTYYQHLAGIPSLSGAQSADAARWTAMSEYYLQLAEAQAQSVKRGRAADAARWTATADYYLQVFGK